MKLKSPKNKGDAYERELAKYLNDEIHDGKEVCYRAPLSGGGRTFQGGGSADLAGTDEIWVEAKRTEKFSPYAAMSQAEKGIAGHGSSELPVVVSRRNQMPTGDSLVVMRLSDWTKLYRQFLKCKGIIRDDLTQIKD